MAKTPSTMTDAHGMVSRWTHQGKSPFYFFFHHCLGNGYGTSRADKVGFRGDGFFIGYTKVDPLNVFIGDQIRFKFHDPFNVEDSLFGDLVLGV